MATMLVDVVSAEAQLYSGDAEAVYARSTEGEIGILPGHQPILIALGDAPVRVQTAEGREVRIEVHNGFLEFRDNHLTVLADSAEIGSA
jgi:F-type H+-transporting ATPase subunit epsilon